MNITVTKYGDPLNLHRNLAYMGHPVLLTGMSALETAYASTFAQFHSMIGLNRLGIRFLNVNLTLHARKIAYNA